MVIEFCPNGSLLSLINGEDYDTSNEFLIQHIFCQLIITLSFLQTEMHIIHRDLKAENILFDEFYNIRIIDFGLSTFSSYGFVNTSDAVGTPSYSAPEILKRDPHDYSVDIWSAGVILYTMCVGKLPFNSESETIYSQLEFPEFIKPDLKDLISRMLQKNPKDRIKIEEIIHHPWFPHQRYEETMEYIKNRGKINDFDFQLDPEIVSKVEKLGFDTEQLSQSLFLQETDEVVALYREFRNMKEIDNLKRFYPFHLEEEGTDYQMRYSFSMDQVNCHPMNRYRKKMAAPIFVFNVIPKSQSIIPSSEELCHSPSKDQYDSDYSDEQIQQEWLKKDALLANDHHEFMVHPAESNLSHFNDGSSMRVLPKKSFMRHRISALSDVVV